METEQQIRKPKYADIKITYCDISDEYMLHNYEGKKATFIDGIENVFWYISQQPYGMNISFPKNKLNLISKTEIQAIKAVNELHNKVLTLDLESRLNVEKNSSKQIKN